MSAPKKSPESQIRRAAEEIVGHLGAALRQATSTDDAIIIGHIQKAYVEACRLLSGSHL